MTILSVITLSSFDSKLNYNNNKGTQEAGSERKLSVPVSVSAKISVSVLADISTFIPIEISAHKNAS
jgi:hypothetical protein